MKGKIFNTQEIIKKISEKIKNWLKKKKKIDDFGNIKVSKNSGIIINNSTTKITYER